MPSLKPLNILGYQIIDTLIKAGHVVISTGGGGIPVYQKNGRSVGIEAVIDKDFAYKKLAQLIDMGILLILTGVENAYIHFNKPGWLFNLLNQNKGEK